MWDERYAHEEYAYGTEPNEFLAAHAARIPRGRVLCLADGEGRNGVWLAQQGYDVTSVDLSAVGLEKARKLAARRNVRINTIQADLAVYDIEPNAWEGIVLIFGHLPPHIRRRLLQQAVAGLRPGGAFLLELYTPRQLEFGTGGPREVELLGKLEDLRAELDGLQFEIAQEIEREIYEGKYHGGHSAVVQILGLKPDAQ
ncbi:MAG TPA: class I SAM-dependent methyltransferase [Blastocatellia bacterium]|nr:class I SAM-dependent methyltransferase [Blastocatellia bacterium]